MQASRREALAAVISMAAAAVLEAGQDASQSQPARPPGMPPTRNPFPSDPSVVPEVPKPDSRTLKANREAIKKDVARLTELVQQLQSGLDANSMTDVLSLDVLKKCDEIEKLAKQVRSLVKA